MRQWCNRCQRFHDCEPVDPDKIAAEMAQQIADDIDAKIVIELIKIATRDKNELRKTDP
jgi:hypothetical protein